MSYPILLVDDNPDACATTAKMLWTCGYQVDVAYDPQTAIVLTDKTPYALVIVDFQMTAMNGVDLFCKMRERRPDVSGILITGYASDELTSAAHAAGITFVLAKPVEFTELIQLIERYQGVPW
jgi:CheY-like chemotaxis protein